MSKFVKVTGWHHQKQEDFQFSVNLEHVTRITANTEGRAVLHLGSDAVTLGFSYASFIEKMEKVPSLWAAEDTPETA
jgi:hypothetical protein